MNKSREEILDGFLKPRPGDWQETQEYLEEVRAYPSAATKSIATMRTYVQVVRRFLNHMQADPSKVTKRMLQTYFNHLSKS